MASEILEAITANDPARLERALADDPASARARDDEGISAIMTARYYGRRELVERLRPLAGPFDVFEAATLGENERLRELLAADGSLARAWSPDGYTPLHLAAFFGQPEAARMLLEAGADTEAVSRNAMAVLPLNSAAAGNHFEVARLLVEHGANVNARTHMDYTPLHAAAEHGEGALVDLLMERGADPTARTTNGQTPADAAAEKGHAALADRLRELSAQPSAQK